MELLLDLILTPILKAIGLVIHVIFWSCCWLIVGPFRVIRSLLRKPDT